MQIKDYERGVWYRKPQECTLSVKHRGRWQELQTGACLSPLRAGLLRAMQWSPLAMKASFAKDMSFEAVGVSTTSPVFFTKEGQHLIRYLENAPQYGGQFQRNQRRSCAKSRNYQLDWVGDGCIQAMTHGMRVFLNMREFPFSCALFYHLCKAGHDVDAAFIVSHAVYAMDGRLRILVGVGHAAMPELPCKRDLAKAVDSWKAQRPSDRLISEKGYDGITRYVFNAGKIRQLDPLELSLDTLFDLSASY